ncbi:MAG: PAS domain S-box protein [candidate division Zixibacteria bacterium]|nr:PAS domain S-box protein [candidate division Zixibacteria bacterium]
MAKPLRVLIAEDSENDALLMVNELRRGGYDPTYERVDTAEAMRRALGGSHWDVVLADYTMPGFSALDALNIVQEVGVDLPFIVVSGSIGEDIAVEAMRSGAHDYIMKNNMTRLAAAVERELRQAEGRHLKYKAEMALKETNQTLWALIKSSPLAIVTVDLQRNVTMWNPAAERMFGWNEKEVLGSTIPIVPKDKHPEFREIFERAMEGQATTIFETQRKRKDGRLIDVSLTTAALYDSGGGVTGAMAVFADITERKRAEKLAQEVENRNRAILKSAIDGIIVIDHRGLVVEFNPAAEKIFGFKRERVLGREMAELIIPPAQREAHREGLRRLLATGEGKALGQRLEMTARRADGTEFPVEFSIQRIGLSEPPLFTGFVRDISDLKQAEDFLRQSENKFRVLAEATSAGIFIFQGTKMRHVNAAAERIIGYSREELLQIDFWEVIHPDFRELVKGRGLARQKGEAVPQRYEVKILTKNKEERWVDFTAGIIDLEGSPAVLGTVIEITQRKQAEEALRKNEALLAKTQQMAHLGGWVLDLSNMEDINQNELRWTEETFRIFGYQPGEIEVTNDLFFQLVHPEDRPKIREAVSRALAEKKPYSIEHRILRPDGVERLIHEHVDIVFDEKSGRPLRMLGTAQDITERRRGEVALRESEERFRQIADNISEVFWLTDPSKNQMIYVSPGYERMWGRSCDSLYQNPMSWVDVIHPEDRQRVLEAATTKQVKGEFNEEYRIVRPDGSLLWIRDRAYPIRNEKGEVHRIAGIAEDITKEKQLADQLRQVQKMEAVGQMAGGIAHDFNNLLTAIAGYTDFVLERVEPDSPLKADVEEIKKGTVRAAALTRQLLAFSRRQVMQPAVLNLNELINGMEGMLRRLVGENVELATVPAPQLTPIKADPHQLEQVIMNLALNAGDAMPQGGRLTIETANVELDESFVQLHAGAQPGAYALLAVSDTGFGMDAEVQKHLFEPFFTTKEKGKGTGLGLATVYGIVKQSGGYVSVYSEPGRGSSFKIYLPRFVEPHAEKPVKTAPAKTEGGTETILLVEDEEAVRALAAKILRAKKYTVLEAGDGHEAQEVLKKHTGALDLLLTDVVMPKMGGPELAKALRRTRQGLKVLFMTGYTDHSAFREGTLPPGTALLQKPFSPRVLAQKVREVLDGSKSASSSAAEAEKPGKPAVKK